MKSTKNAEKLFDAITHIREDYILEATDHEFKQAAAKKPWTARHALRYAGPIAAALCLSLLLGIFFWPSPVATSAFAIVEATYPGMAAYPNEADYYATDGSFDDDAYFEAYEAWLDGQEAQNRPSGFADGIQPFVISSAQQFLAGSPTENQVYSPLNIYLALGMLAEVTDGNSREQILDLLGHDDVRSLRTQANALWNASYNDDGIYTSILSNSLWLREDIPYNMETMQTLADNYYASSYHGTMGSDEFNEMLHTWLNEHTNHHLTDSADEQSFDENTLLALATAITYRTKWAESFNPEQTAPATFHSPAGDITCDFMNQSMHRNLYWGDNFSAIKQYETNGSSMVFILPDEDIDASDLLTDPEAFDFMLSDLSGKTWENAGSYQVNFSIPKFDVSFSLSLIDGLQQLGIEDVFDTARSDFSPMTEHAEGVCVSQINHSARVTIDEEGYEAAAFTLTTADATAAFEEDEPVDFVLDRPFLFITLNPDGLPMFIGIVNQPVE